MRSSVCLIAFGLAAFASARTNDGCVNACLIDPNQGGMHFCQSKCAVGAVQEESSSDETTGKTSGKTNNETMQEPVSPNANMNAEQQDQSKLLRLRAINSDRTGPSCVTKCVDQIEKSPCADKSFNEFAYCIYSTCSDPYETTRFFLKSMHLTAEAISSSDCTVEKNDKSHELSLNSTCNKVPFAFNSIKTEGMASSKTAGPGCSVLIYGSEDCSGNRIKDARLDRMANEECFEQSGRSAAVSCPNAGAAAEAYLQALCSKDSKSVDRIPPLVPTYTNSADSKVGGNKTNDDDGDDDEDREESSSSRTVVASLTYFALAMMMLGAATVF